MEELFLISFLFALEQFWRCSSHSGAALWRTCKRYLYKQLHVDWLSNGAQLGRSVLAWARQVFEGVTPLRPSYSVSFPIGLFMGQNIVHSSPVWLMLWSSILFSWLSGCVQYEDKWYPPGHCSLNPICVPPFRLHAHCAPWMLTPVLRVALWQPMNQVTPPPKSCELDPRPTFLLQKFVDDLYFHFSQYTLAR